MSYPTSEIQNPTSDIQRANNHAIMTVDLMDLP